MESLVKHAYDLYSNCLNKLMFLHKEIEKINLNKNNFTIISCHAEASTFPVTPVL